MERTTSTSQGLRFASSRYPGALEQLICARAKSRQKIRFAICYERKPMVNSRFATPRLRKTMKTPCKKVIFFGDKLHEIGKR